MAYSLKENLMKEDRLSGGHRMCAGCGSPIAVRTVLRALNPEDKAVVCSATSCLEVSTFMYPYTAWKDSFIHNAFENAAATISGVETAYRAMKKRGKLDDTYKFIAFGGDGGTYDIGFQSLSGAMERGHDMVYVCYDNEAYMNTGIQRSSSTPHFADTTTTPQGTVIPGKMQQKKNLTKIMVAHGIPYVAQTTFIGNFKDITEKAHKAIYTPGAAFLNVMAPCPRGWRYPSEKLMEVTKMAVESLRYTGLDYVIVDTEHSPAGIESAAAQIAAAQGAGLTALARANEISRTAVLRLLDVGAQGVVVPCVETVEEVRELVRYAKFAPLGNRGFCPTRDGGWGHAAHAVSISGYMETSNRETLLLPQCETVGCLEHIEEITAMDGVDGIFVGPFDLSIALGHPGEFNAPVVHDAILRVQAACKRSGKLSIIFTGSAAASRQRFAEGFDSVTMGMDSLFYVEMYKNLVADVWGK